MKYTKRRLNDSTAYRYALWLDLGRARGGARHGGGQRQRQRYEPHTNGLLMYRLGGAADAPVGDIDLWSILAPLRSLVVASRFKNAHS